MIFFSPHFQLPVNLASLSERTDVALRTENINATSFQEQSKEAAMVYAKAVRLVYESFQDAYATLKKSTRLL